MHTTKLQQSLDISAMLCYQPEGSVHGKSARACVEFMCICARDALQRTPQQLTMMHRTSKAMEVEV